MESCYFCILRSWDHRHEPVRQDLDNFLPRLALNCDLHISTSQVAGITDVNQYTWLLEQYFDMWDVLPLVLQEAI
jgi:hypothetical protein